MKYKKIEVIWFIILLILLAAALYMPVLFGAAVLQWIIISAVTVLALLAVYVIIRLRSWNGIMTGHLYTCDLHVFMEDIQELINAKYVFKSTKTKLQFLIVDALLDSGKFEQAFVVLQAIDTNHAPRQFSNSNYEYLTYSVKYHIYMEDKDAAESELILLGMETEKYKNYKRKYSSLRATCADLQNRLMFLKNEYKDCREYFSEIFDAPFKTPYEKSFAAYYLGVISLEKKETERAKDCFNYIVENGNTLFIVEKAGEQLELLSAKAV